MGTSKKLLLLIIHPDPDWGQRGCKSLLLVKSKFEVSIESYSVTAPALALGTVPGSVQDLSPKDSLT